MERPFSFDTLANVFVNILFVVIPDPSRTGLSDMRLEFNTHLETVSQAILLLVIQ